MPFESFADLARVGLKRSVVGATRVLIKTEHKAGKRSQTQFRLAVDLVEKAGWVAGEDRVEIYIDGETRTIKLRKVAVGGYKLLGSASARPTLKFTVAKGMPIVNEGPVEAADVIVVAGEILFTLPEQATIALT